MIVIEDVQVRNIRIPLKQPINNPIFRFTDSDYTIVNIRGNNGMDGWSFAFGASHAKLIVKELSQLLIGQPLDIRRLWNNMISSRVVRFDRGGIAMRAVSAIDIALWDLYGKSVNQPIYRLLGGCNKPVPVYYSGGHYPAEAKTTEDLVNYLVKDFTEAYARGFRSFKMKIGKMSIPVELERIKACRQAIGPECKLMLDAFCAYDADEIISMAAKFEKYDISWLEEPVALDDIKNCAYVASHISMPVATGEANFTLAQFRDIIDNKAARILMPDICYIGGFTGYTLFAGIVAYTGLQLSPHWCHDLSVQLALFIPEIINLEYMDKNSALFLIQKVIKNPVIAKDGVVYAPEGSGHGLILDEYTVNQYLAE